MEKSDKWEKIKDYAIHDHKTNDAEYNEGRNDIIKGHISSMAAKYYLQCSGLD